ncbi:esterase [Natronospirillum operosum]|uniref:Esterase n=1 Tax=Natronospirillum operosum TaxID=2759953 RepID=A0A4Z0W1E3_9GAMM|nr:YqiA/YcfP family alpha/beta fold hydrolase [Natronospirillum operosum]TGG90233.1 esterase [Natronospirillum operosum]
MILYIHGFASSGFGSKARYFRALATERGLPFMAPSLPWIPQLAIHTLYDIIDAVGRQQPVHLIGSSLGGYYGLHLAHRYDLKVALINPSVRPADTLGDHTGLVTHFHDGSRFEWTASHAQELSRLEVPPAPDLQARTLLLVQQGDATLDYRQALQHLPEATQVVEPGGDHGFQGIERHAERILRFFGD